MEKDIIIIMVNTPLRTLMPRKKMQFNPIGRVSLARENEAGGIWGQEVHIFHVNV